MMKSATRRTILSLILAAGAMGTVGGLVAPRAAQAETQPHMHQALAILKNARNELMKGSSDKGGHRLKALASVNSAIADVQRGIAYDNANKKDTQPKNRRPYLRRMR